MRDVLVDTTLGQYELQEQLGQGGTAIVYRAFQPSLRRAVAVKVLPLAVRADPTLPTRFRREARLAANLLHPNIVPVYDFGQWANCLYIVMPLITGGTLKARVDAALPLEATIRLVGQVADALAHAHNQGVYHRDVKPANVLLAARDWAMLGDFGIARALGETTRLTHPYGTIGTPVYMAPEQWQGREVDGRADIYSLGVILYELLAGSPPFKAATPVGLMRQHLEAPVPSLAARGRDVPAAVQAVVEMALAKRPEDRYQHAGELKAALETAVHAGAAVQEPTLVNIGSASTGSVNARPSPAPNLGRTLRLEEQRRQPHVKTRRMRSVSAFSMMLGLMLVLGVVVAGGTAYLLAGDRGSPDARALAQRGATPAGQTASGVAPADAPAAPSVHDDARFAEIERRVAEYAQAVNAGDYARALDVCCTPSFRSRLAREQWQTAVAGMADLQPSTPFRYTSVEPTRIVAEVSYSFLLGGERQYAISRWTFVPAGEAWLLDEV